MGNIINVLKGWDIEIPKEYDIPEYLIKTYSNNTFFIDQCPFKANKKHDQIEVLYQEVIERKKAKKEFLFLEEKYRRVLTMLWLYNDLFVESNLGQFRLKHKNKMIEKEYRGLFSNLYKKFNNLELVDIGSRMDLELIIQLGMRCNWNYTYFYLKDYEIIINISWSCFMIFFNNLNIIPTISDIVMTEGLYLRPTMKDL